MPDGVEVPPVPPTPQVSEIPPTPAPNPLSSKPKPSEWKSDFSRLETLIIKIEAKIDGHSHPQPLPPIPPLSPPLPPVSKNGTYHFVILARPNQQFSPTLEETRQVYSGIRQAPLPKFPIGPIPQMVEYVDSIPVRVYKGSKAVNGKLYDIYKGRYPQ